MRIVKRLILFSAIVMLILLIQPSQVSPAIASRSSAIGNAFNYQFKKQSDKNGWTQITGAWFVKKGKFKAISALNYYASVAKKGTYKTLTYSAKMKAASKYNYGLYFRGRPFVEYSKFLWRNGYVFLINNNGRYFIGYLKDGKITQVKEGASAKINKKGWNTLKVTAKGKTLEFFINGKRVSRNRLNVFSDGKVGITYARFGSKNGFQVDWAKLSTSVP